MSVAEQADARTGEPGPVGAQLARARIAHGLSVDDLYERTNVRPVVDHRARARRHRAERRRGLRARASAHARRRRSGWTSPRCSPPSTRATRHRAPPVLVPDTDAARGQPALAAGRRPTGPRWPLVMAAVLVVVIVVALRAAAASRSKDGKSPTRRSRQPAAGEREDDRSEADPAPAVADLPGAGPGRHGAHHPDRQARLARRHDERGVSLIQRVVAALAEAARSACGRGAERRRSATRAPRRFRATAIRSARSGRRGRSSA